MKSRTTISDKYKALKALLTHKQYRRVLLYYLGENTMTGEIGMSLRQVAKIEGVAHSAIFKSLRQAEKKIRNFGHKIPW